MPEPRIFGVTGWKNTGKTTLLAALVSELGSRGFKVSTVKHAHHAFDVDHEGRDSWKHRKAGTHETMVSSGRRWALMHELDKDENELTLAQIVSKMSPCDLVLVEGYKRDSHPKIEVFGSGASGEPPIWPDDPTVVALASDSPQPDCHLPVLARDNVEAIAAFIIRYLKLESGGETSNAAQ